MPLAVTHVILSIIAVDLYRDYVARHKKYFTLWTILIGGIAGLLPDMDIPIYHLMNSVGYAVPLLAHGGIMHTPVFGLVFLIPFGVFWALGKHRLAAIFLVVTFGILFHLFLDWLIGGGHIDGMMLGFPFTSELFRGPFIGLFDPNIPVVQGLDAVILLTWLFHEYRKHKIKDFI